MKQMINLIFLSVTQPFHTLDFEYIIESLISKENKSLHASGSKHFLLKNPRTLDTTDPDWKLQQLPWKKVSCSLPLYW